jgi:hypothetical protein
LKKPSPRSGKRLLLSGVMPPHEPPAKQLQKLSMNSCAKKAALRSMNQGEAAYVGPISALAVIDDDARDESPDESGEHTPELGGQRGSEILVCHGDDRPNCFVDWLEKLVEKYRDLAGTAEEQGQDLGRLKAPIDVMDFIQVIGVELRSRPWTGFLISGTWYEGCIERGNEAQVQANARKVLADLESATS